MDDHIINIELVGSLALKSDVDQLSLDTPDSIKKLVQDYKELSASALQLLACLHILQEACIRGEITAQGGSLSLIENMANSAQKGIDKLTCAKFSFTSSEKE